MEIACLELRLPCLSVALLWVSAESDGWGLGGSPVLLTFALQKHFQLFSGPFQRKKPVQPLPPEHYVPYTAEEQTEELTLLRGCLGFTPCLPPRATSSSPPGTFGHSAWSRGTASCGDTLLNSVQSPRTQV